MSNLNGYTQDDQDASFNKAYFNNAVKDVWKPEEKGKI